MFIRDYPTSVIGWYDILRLLPIAAFLVSCGHYKAIFIYLYCLFCYSKSLL